MNSTDLDNCGTESFTKIITVIAVRVSWIVIAANLVYVLYICKKFPKQIRILSINLVLLDIVGDLLIVLLEIGILVRNPSPKRHYTLHYILEEFLSIAQMLNITSIATDRLLSLIFAMKYQIHIGKTKIKVVCVCIWIASFSLVAGILHNVFVANVVISSFEDLAIYTPYFLLIGVKTVLLLIFIVTNAVIAGYVRSRSQCNSSAVPDFQVKSMTKMIWIILPHAVVYLIIILTSAVSAYSGSMKCVLGINGLNSILIFASSILSAAMYALRFQECRLLFGIIFCYWNTKVSEKLRKIRTEIYAPYLKANNGITYTLDKKISAEAEVSDIEVEINKNQGEDNGGYIHGDTVCESKSDPENNIETTSIQILGNGTIVEYFHR